MNPKRPAHRSESLPSGACRRVRAWFDEGATTSPAAPPWVEEHWATCAECDRLRQEYASKTDLLRSVPVAPVGPAELARFLAAAEDTRRDSSGFRGWLGLTNWRWGAAALLLSGVVLVVWNLRVPEPPISVPHEAKSFGAPAATEEAMPPQMALPAPSPSLVVGRSSGDAVAIHHRGTRRVLRADTGIASATTVVTEEFGEVELVDSHGSMIVVAGGSRVRVTSWSAESRVLDLERGAVTSTVEPLGPDQLYEVRTPNAVVQVVGTEFTVRRRSGHGTRVLCAHGRVLVRSPTGTVLGLIGGGESLFVPESESKEPRSDHAQAASGTAATELTRRETAGESRVARARPNREAAPHRVGSPSRRAALPKRVEPSSIGVPDAGDSAGRASEANSNREVNPPSAESETPADSGERWDAALRQARVALAAGDALEAIRLLEVESFPVSSSRAATLATAWAMQGQRGLAMDAYDEALRLSGARPPAGLLAEVARYAAQHDRQSTGRAIALWKSYYSLYPQGAAAGEALMALAEATDSAAERPQYWREVLAEHSTSRMAPRALSALGAHLVETGQFGAAEALFKRHTESGSLSLVELAWLGLARTAAAQGQLSAARDALARLDERISQPRYAAQAGRLRKALDRASE